MASKAPTQLCPRCPARPQRACHLCGVDPLPTFGGTLRRRGSLGMYQPHKYEQAEAKGGHMSDHVFPWHKQMHAQGDASHVKAQLTKHLSTEQVRG